MRLPRLLGGEITIKGYPLEMVHAEKIVTAVARGTLNTRWRDFMDVVGLAHQRSIDGDALIESVRTVARHRGTDLAPLAQILEGYGDIGQQKWAAWRRKQQLEDHAPEAFPDLIQAFISFADPAITGTHSGRSTVLITPLDTGG
ncbi:MAG: nucleotidyl transferase AbiEii/AbiGii toxin family protein [Acidimicrobiia bacterium]